MTREHHGRGTSQVNAFRWVKTHNRNQTLVIIYAYLDVHASLWEELHKIAIDPDCYILHSYGPACIEAVDANKINTVHGIIQVYQCDTKHDDVFIQPTLQIAGAYPPEDQSYVCVHYKSFKLG